MALCKSFLIFSILFCFSHVRAEDVEDLQPLVKSTEETVQSAKTHVEHMLNLDPLPNHEKLPPLVKNESEHLAYEIKKLATNLHEKIAVGEHKPETKDAVTAAVTHLNEAATSLEHVGTDLKQDNIHYYAAADKLLHEIKNILTTGPCHELSPSLKSALNELAHDVNNYQYGIHDVIGPHGGPQGKGHQHENTNHHHVHSHHGTSSEESSEEKTSSGHHSHNHHHHH